MPLLHARLTDVRPMWATEGARVNLVGSGFAVDGEGLPEVRMGGVPARVVFASSGMLGVLVPPGLEAGRVPVEVEGAPTDRVLLGVATPLASDIHQVDNPVFDRDGNLYVADSGARGKQVPVSIFRIRPDGTREPFVTGIVNATAMAFGPDGDLYVTSRFEGAVYRVRPDGHAEVFASDLGIACGLAFGPDGSLFVGDRGGTVFRVGAGGRAQAFAALPPSVAAFHLAMAPDGSLYVTAPTLSPVDSVYRIDPQGQVSAFYTGFGRPQGLTFDARGVLYVVEALAGSSGVYRFTRDGTAEHVGAAAGLVGVAIDPVHGIALSSNDTLYRLPVRR
jgi:sugar lactone lactonase YvrE